METGRRWVIWRLVLFLACFVVLALAAALFSREPPDGDFEFYFYMWYFTAPLAFIVWMTFVPVVCAIYLRIRFGARSIALTKPSMNTRFLTLEDISHCFHALGIVIVGGACGTLVGYGVAHQVVFPYSIHEIAGGVGMCAGSHLTSRFYMHFFGRSGREAPSSTSEHPEQSNSIERAGGPPPPPPGSSPTAERHDADSVVRHQVEPHRGTLILTFGILGVFLCFLFGIVAWVLANRDLALMRDGQMDRSGHTLTNAGRICGMVGIFLALSFVALALLFVYVVSEFL